jgi:hypothetical protein
MARAAVASTTLTSGIPQYGYDAAGPVAPKDCKFRQPIQDLWINPPCQSQVRIAPANPENTAIVTGLMLHVVMFENGMDQPAINTSLLETLLRVIGKASMCLSGHGYSLFYGEA